MKILKIRTLTINKYPHVIRLPKVFFSRNEIKKGDKFDLFITETGELILKKQ